MYSLVVLVMLSREGMIKMVPFLNLHMLMRQAGGKEAGRGAGGEHSGRQFLNAWTTKGTRTNSYIAIWSNTPHWITGLSRCLCLFVCLFVCSFVFVCSLVCLFSLRFRTENHKPTLKASLQQNMRTRARKQTKLAQSTHTIWGPEPSHNPKQATKQTNANKQANKQAAKQTNYIKPHRFQPRNEQNSEQQTNKQASKQTNNLSNLSPHVHRNLHIIGQQWRRALESLFVCLCLFFLFAWFMLFVFVVVWLSVWFILRTAWRRLLRLICSLLFSSACFLLDA